MAATFAFLPAMLHDHCMAFPAEFQFANEDDFVQRFVIPLLQRPGFSVIANYHRSHGELGKNLVFAEIDRFGHT